MEFLIALPFILIVAALIYMAVKEIRASAKQKRENDAALKKLQDEIAENQRKMERQRVQEVVEREKRTKRQPASLDTVSRQPKSSSFSEGGYRKNLPIYEKDHRETSTTHPHYDTANILLMAALVDSMQHREPVVETCAPAPTPEPYSYSSPAPSPSSCYNSSSYDSSSGSDSYSSSDSGSYSSSD